MCLKEICEKVIIPNGISEKQQLRLSEVAKSACMYPNAAPVFVYSWDETSAAVTYQLPSVAQSLQP